MKFKKGDTPWNKGTKGVCKSWNKGIPMSEESKKKLSESLKGKPSPMKGKKTGKPAWNRGISPSLDSRRKMSESLLKRYESGSFPKQTGTKIEVKIKEELIKRGYKENIDFIHQFNFNNKFMCDFCFPKQKVIIEADGDFWHANPDKYQLENLHPHQIKGIKRDKSKTAYIRKCDNGSWKLLRFWESDINKDVVKCVDIIKDNLLN